MNIESWIAGNWHWLLTCVFVGVLAYTRVTKVDHVERALKEHERSPSPHSACPVHDNILNEINRKLERIDRRVYRLATGVDEEQGGD